MFLHKKINPLEFRRLEAKIKKLEESTYKNNSKDTVNLPQQLLILKHLNLLDTLTNLKLSREQKAIILSKLLNRSFDNIRHLLSKINSKRSKIITDDNYTVLYRIFKKAGLKQKTLEIENILEEIEKQDSENQ